MFQPSQADVRKFFCAASANLFIFEYLEAYPLTALD